VTEGPLPDDRLPQEPVDADEPPPEDRRYPSTIGGAFYLVVLLTTAVGFVIVVTDDWRVGIRWVALSLVAASAARLVLPRRDAGMLAVRNRWFDCLLLAGVGAALLVLAQTIPDQPL
jgi:hypothetical protein